LTGDLKNLDRINSSITKVVVEYCERIISSVGAEVRSIAVYGSATGPDYIPKHSNINITVVVEEISHNTLRSLLETVRWGLKRKIVPPLLLTEDYILSSLDVFPIEFSEIKDTAVIVYGEDFFGSLKMDPGHLRLECESQLKAALLRTRQAYLELGLTKKGAERVLHTSLTSLIPVMRGLLRLKGIEPPRRKADVIMALGEAFGLDGSVFIAILQDKAGDEKIGDKEAHVVLGRYIEQLERLAEKSNQL